MLNHQSISRQPHPLLPLSSTSWLDITNWCERYNRYNKYPVSTLERFAIGLYQINQGFDWQDLSNKAESYMSAFLHFHMVDCMIRINEPPFYPVDIIHYDTLPMISRSNRILYLISKSQQQIFYNIKMKKTQRGKSRFNQKLLEDTLFDLQVNMISLVPKSYRGEGLYNATKIMTGII